MHLIHRGIINKSFKENLLKSFKQSFKKGYGIETDIHATKDGQFICFHDFTLSRIFKKNLSIKNLNYSNYLERYGRYSKLAEELDFYLFKFGFISKKFVVDNQ